MTPKEIEAAFGAGPYRVEQRTTTCADICTPKGTTVATCSWAGQAKARADLLCALLNAAARSPIRPAQAAEPAVLGLLAGMVRPVEGVERNQPGYQHVKGWNEALLQAMDYVRGGALAVPQQAAEPSKVVLTAPPRIWLQVSDDVADTDAPFPAGAEGVTWEKNSVLACEVPYVRADLGAAQAAEERKPLSEEQITAGWNQECVTTNPYCVSLTSWKKAVRWAERALGIKGD